jgi:hypothetical protein
LACGKNCGIPGNTTRRSFASAAAWSTGLVFWCDQLTPTVNSPNSVGLNVCNAVVTQPTVSISYLVAICGQPAPVEPRIETPPERFS